MKFALFYHSLVSDWNHGNAHFLRGISRELLARGHGVSIFEPADGWSRQNLLRDHGTAPLLQFREFYPELHSRFYRRENLDLEQIAAEHQVILVHEWNATWLVNRLARLRRLSTGFRLLFHDTHHRALSDPAWLARFDLEGFDGVLAFGESLAEVYRRRGWGRRVWTWHEAADTRLFRPTPAAESPLPPGDIIWIGNWGDGERSRELEELLIRPALDLQLRLRIHGVRYPREVVTQLARRGIHYGGWLANFQAPALFANHRATVHVPRHYYRRRLRGIPTIRPFEAMACGIPLIWADWHDSEGLFRAGRDYLPAASGTAVKRHLRQLIHEPAFARQLGRQAVTTIQRHHSCARRAEELLDIVAALTLPDDRKRTGEERRA